MLPHARRQPSLLPNRERCGRGQNQLCLFAHLPMPPGHLIAIINSSEQSKIYINEKNKEVSARGEGTQLADDKELRINDGLGKF